MVSKCADVAVYALLTNAVSKAPAVKRPTMKPTTTAKTMA